MSGRMDEPLFTEPPAHLDDLARRVIGAAIEVHRHLGAGYLESIYERALRRELTGRGIAFESQVVIPILYKDQSIGEAQLDLLVEGELVVELKAVERLLEIHRAQVISYLKATGAQLGLLINFNTPVLKDGIRRVIWHSEPRSLAPLRLGGSTSGA
jgi:GxxExxY protein